MTRLPMIVTAHRGNTFKKPQSSMAVIISAGSVMDEDAAMPACLHDRRHKPLQYRKQRYH